MTSQGSTARALAALGVILLAGCQVAGFQIHMNMNMLPASMVREPEAWAVGGAAVDGIFAMSAPNPEDPRTIEQSVQMLTPYFKKPLALIQTWQMWSGQTTEGINYTNYIGIWEKRYPGTTITDSFLWDEDQESSTLSVAQLDQLQAVGYLKVWINTRDYGADDYDMARVQAAITHPWTKGVVIEGTPQATNNVETPARLAIARFTLKQGKPVFFLIPPSGPGNPTYAQAAAPYWERIRTMMNDIRAGLGDAAVKSDMVRIVVAGYSGFGYNIGWDYLPESNPDGTPFNSFAGGLYYLARLKNTLLDSGISTAACAGALFVPGTTGLTGTSGKCVQPRMYP